MTTRKDWPALWKCRCGWIYAEIESAKELATTGTIDQPGKYTACMRCGTPSLQFVPAKPSDVPLLSSPPPIIIKRK